MTHLTRLTAKIIDASFDNASVKWVMRDKGVVNTTLKPENFVRCVYGDYIDLKFAKYALADVVSFDITDKQGVPISRLSKALMWLRKHFIDLQSQSEYHLL